MRSNSKVSLLAKILLPFLVLLALAPRPVPVLVTNGLSGAVRAEKRGDFNVRAALLHGVLQMTPWRADLWEQAGMSAFTAQAFTVAIHDLKQAQQIGSLSPQGKMALGMAYRETGNPESAIQVWQKLALQADAPAEVYALLLLELSDQNDLAAVISFLEGWVSRKPDDAQAVYRLGLYRSLDEPKVASRLLQQALVQDPSLAKDARIVQGALTVVGSSDQPAYRLLVTGRALASIEEWRLAKTAFEWAVEIDPNYAEAWAFLGEARQQVNERVGDAFERARSLSPTSTLVQALEAVYWRRLGRVDVALVYLHAIADQEPENAWWQVELGSAISQMGNLPEALAYYQRAVEIDPGSATYWRLLSVFCIENNVEVETAGLEAARQAVLLTPNDPDALDVMGQAMVSMQDLASAERFFLRALDNDPDHNFAALHLALVYIDQGRQNDAYPLLKQVAEAEPEQQAGQQALRYLEMFNQ